MLICELCIHASENQTSSSGWIFLPGMENTAGWLSVAMLKWAVSLFTVVFVTSDISPANTPSTCIITVFALTVLMHNKR